MHAEQLLYLDTDFISRLYESECNVSPTTMITRTQRLQAAASLAFFSGGGSASESKSYGISAMEMLGKLKKKLEAYPEFSPSNLAMDAPSKHIWASGLLGVTTVKVTRTTHTITIVGKPKPTNPSESDGVVGEEAYFSLKCSGATFALSPTDEYFVPGVAAFKGLSHLVLDRISIPCKALLRVFSASTSFPERVAVPLVMYDA